ncbi:response regulator [Proteobacteria bacterium 005FR1]|nr:response regulator [Proteobacteria bacterium 005FR1]
MSYPTRSRDDRRARFSRTLGPVVIPLMILLLSGFPILSSGQQSPTATLIDEVRSYSLGQGAWIIPDEGQDWRSIAGASPQSDWANDGRLISLERQDLPTWVRVDLSNEGSETSEWMLDTASTFGGRMTLYLLSDGELRQLYEVDSYRSFDTRPYNYREVVFPLQLAPGHNQLLLHVEEMEVTLFSLTLEPRQEFLTAEKVENWFSGIFFGIMLALMIYHIIIAGATFDKVYLLYSFFIGSSIIYALVRDGVGFQYLWPDLPWVDVDLGAVFYYLPALVAIVFTVSFLHLPELSRAFTRFFQLIFAGLTVLVLLRMANLPIPIAVLNLVVLISTVSIIAAGVFALWRRYSYARSFLLAWTVYCLALANWLLAIGGAPALFPLQSYTVLQLSFMAQLLLLSSALAHRIRILRVAKLEAEAESRAQSNFLARMSHEIRTPLSGVLGMSELLAERLSDPIATNYNNIIRSSGSSLLAIINDILDYSKFSSGKMELERIPFDIRKLASESLDLFSSQADKKNIALNAEFDAALPQWVEGDPTRLRQVMLNFLSNALKFTDAGTITLCIGPVPGREHMLEIAVRDSGQGIPADEQPKLFEPFTQANSATSRKHGGTGLGLSICKQIAAMMDGEIGVTSRERQGSTFWITARLPATEPLTADPEQVSSNLHQRPVAAPAAALRPLQVLIAEDNQVNQMVIEGILKRLAQQPEVVSDGEDAVAKICSGARYDLVLMDCEMPGMDGITATRRIREWEAQSGAERTAIVALTAHAVKAQMAACVEAGMDDCLSKPVEIEKLEEVLRRLALGHEATEQKRSLKAV